MTVNRIEFVQEDSSRLDAFHDAAYDYEPQGSTYPVERVYKLVNSDGDEQYIAVTLHYDSYGSAVDSVTHPRLVKPTEKTVVKFVDA